MTFLNPHKSLSKRRRRVLGALGILGLFAVWTAASFLVPNSALPSPWEVAKAFWYLLTQRGLFSQAVISFARVSSATIICGVFGVPLGIMMGSSQSINAFFAPVLDPLKSAPLIAMLPIFMLLFGIEEIMKISFLTFGAIVYVIPLTRDAIRSVPKEYYVLAEDIGATQWERLRHILIPLAMPTIFTALMVAFGICWTYVVVAEMVNAQEGLGYMIQVCRRMSATDQVWALVITILAIATTFEFILHFVKKVSFRWNQEAS